MSRATRQTELSDDEGTQSKFRDKGAMDFGMGSDFGLRFMMKKEMKQKDQDDNAIIEEILKEVDEEKDFRAVPQMMAEKYREEKKDEAQ